MEEEIPSGHYILKHHKAQTLKMNMPENSGTISGRKVAARSKSFGIFQCHVH